VNDALAAAIQNSGVAYVVVLSSIGATNPTKYDGLYNLEKKLEAIAGPMRCSCGQLFHGKYATVGVIQIVREASPARSVRICTCNESPTRDIGAPRPGYLLKRTSWKQSRGCSGLVIR